MNREKKQEKKKLHSCDCTHKQNGTNKQHVCSITCTIDLPRRFTSITRAHMQYGTQPVEFNRRLIDTIHTVMDVCNRWLLLWRKYCECHHLIVFRVSLSYFVFAVVCMCLSQWVLIFLLVLFARSRTGCLQVLALSISNSHPHTHTTIRFCILVYCLR